MTKPLRVQPPSAGEIEARFRSPAVVSLRPLILGGIRALSIVRRFGWTADGLELLRGNDAPLILAANHASHADTAAVLGTLPRGLRGRTCVAAALDVFGRTSDPRLLRVVRRECLQTIVAAGFHAFAFDRHGPPLRSVRTAADLMRAGWSLLLYPEGTRSRTGDIGSFKAGVGILARKTGRPVVPIHVSGGRSILPCDAFMPQRGHAVVRFGPPLRFQSGETASSFAERLRQRVCALAAAPHDESTRAHVEVPSDLPVVRPQQRSA
jgi:1-acyl-sn-glycerol-3-phosphate acyltransferase